MKRAVVLILCSLLVTFSITASAETKPADQKWLEAVQKMVAKGEHRVSTPNVERVNLLKTWAKKHGYLVDVAKTDVGYRIEVTRQMAQK